MKKRFDDLFSALMLLAAIGVVLAGAWVLAHSIERAKAEPAPIPVAPLHLEPPAPEFVPVPEPLEEPAEESPPDAYDPAVPLSAELQAVWRGVCAETGVPEALVLGVIEVESCFQADAVSAEGCVGLMQLNPKYFPDKLSPADNIRHGVRYLGELLERYGDPAAALTAYNAGSDTGNRAYANAVLAAAERWAAG